MCKDCDTANDADFRFCKKCGNPRHLLIQTDDLEEKREHLLTKIDERISKLDGIINSATYSKQKQNLKSELQDFFYTLDPFKNVFNAYQRMFENFSYSRNVMAEPNYTVAIVNFVMNMG